MPRWSKLALWTLAAVIVTGLSVRLALTEDLVARVKALLPRVSLALLALVLPLTVVLNLVRAVRYAMALGVSGPGVMRRMFEISVWLVFLGFMIPFKVGELSFPVLAKQAFDKAFATSLAALLYSRVTDLLAVIAIGGFALTSLGFNGGASSSVWLRAALPFATGASVVLIALPFLVTRARVVAGRFTSSPRVLGLVDRLFEGCRLVASPAAHARYLALTVVIWGLLASTSLLSMRAMGAASSFRDGILANTAQSITFAFPVSGVAGIGPLQASWASALTLAGWNWDDALANALLAHVTMLACAAILSVGALVSRALSRGPGARHPARAASLTSQAK